MKHWTLILQQLKPTPPSCMLRSERMASPEEVDEQCLQLLNELHTCVNGTIIEHVYDIGIQERHSQQQTTDARVALIRDTLANLLSKMNRSRNNYAPIYKLGDELLVEIWMYTTINDRFAIAEVCQRWRRVSLDIGELWAEFNFGYIARRRLYTQLKRVGTATPLHIIATSQRSFKESSAEQYYDRRKGLCWASDRGWCEIDHKRKIVNEEAGYSDEREPDPESSPMPGTLLSYRGPMPPFPLVLLEKMLLRAHTLAATIGKDRSYYVTYETLKYPLPSLQRLFLTVGSNTGGPVLDRDTYAASMTGKWFGGVTPQLRELSLSHIHAPWDDPIYSNLTYLRLHLPGRLARPSQLLQILRQCPEIEYLDITNCMSGHVQDQSWSRFDQSPPLGPVGQEDREVGIGDDNGGKPGKSRTGSRLMVVLNKLWYLHLEESSSAECARFLSRLSCPSLQTLVICTTELISFTWGTGDRAGRRSNRPFNALSSVFERTTQLQLSFTDSGCFTVIGRPGETSWDHPRYSPRWWQGTGSEKRNTGPGWSISYRRRPSYLYSSVISEQLRQFLQNLEVAGVRYEQIELVDITGQCDFGDEFYRELLARCSCLRRLHIRPWPKFVANGSGVFGTLGAFPSMANLLGRFDGQTAMRVLRNVVGRSMCPELEQVYLMQFTSPAWELADWVEKRSRRRGRNKKGTGLKRIVVDVFHDLEESTDRTRWMEDASVLDEKSRSRIEDALGMQQSHDRRDNPPEGDGDVGSNGDEYGLVWRNSQRERFIAAQKSKNERPRFSRVRHPFMFPFAYDPFAYEH